MVYNITGLSNATGLAAVTRELNILTQPQGLFSIFLLFASAMVTAAILGREDFSIQALAASAVITLEAIIMWMLQMVSPVYIYVCVSLLVISGVIAMWR